jgi:hypothetical protein
MLPLLWRGLSEAGQMSTVSFRGRTRFTNIPIVRRGTPPLPVTRSMSAKEIFRQQRMAA